MPRAVRFVLSLLLVTLTAALSAQNPIRYIYDELGRLVGVIDANGDAAEYHYDAVGNLLSITRSSPTQVNIIDFSPDSGPIGQTVTIQGTGFSATPASNTVTFNGTSATVTSATTNSLVVTVPTGATTGLIAVTSPNGSDTSATSFVVAAVNAPTISSFSPTSAVAGTSVTITGTNFDATTATNNQTRFNSTFTPPTASTATTVTALVPTSTGSGRLKIKTPAGTAISTDDFIVPPSPYVVSDIASASRISFATATTVTVSTATKVALRLFDLTAGQRVSVKGTNAVWGQIFGCDLLVGLRSPFDQVLGQPSCMEGDGGFIDTKVAGASGTYTILVDPDSTVTGSVTLTVYDVPADYSAAITAGGSAVTATMSTPGQNGVLTFSGTASQRVSLLGTNGLGGQVAFACDVNASLLKLDGTVLAGPACMEGGGFIDATTLPATGTYRIRVDPQAHSTGSVTFNLYSVTDSTGTITANGTPVALSFVPGQNGTLTFSGTSGQRVSLLGTNGMSGQIFAACDVNVTIRKPDTTVLAGPTCMEGQGYIDTITLPAIGSYTIEINPVEHAFGNLTLKLYTVTDNTDTITAGGSAVTQSFVPGQNGTLTFSGTSGQRISLLGTNGMAGTVWFGCDVNVTIRKPDTSVLTGPTCMEGGGFIEPHTLPATGTYTIEIDPQAESSGNLTLALYSVTDYSNTITAGGSAVTVSITTPGQNGSVTFSGTNGQRVFLNGTNGTISAQVLTCDVSVTIRKPDTTVLAGPVCMEGTGWIDLQTLPSTGTYTIEVDPLAAATGNLTLTLYDVPADTSGSVSVNGSAVGVTLSTPGQNGTLTFSGAASQQITVQAASNTFGQLTVRLLKPDGSTLTSNTSAGGSFSLTQQTLPTTGTYTLVADPTGPNTGAVNISVTNP
jgi:YD repeat-containing protein